MADSTPQLFGGGWTETKLDILHGYLKAYNKALSKQPFRRVYVDAFAGTGYREARKANLGPDIFNEVQEEESEFLKGSAHRALEVDPAFHHFVFVESDSEKIDELQKLKNIFSSKASEIQIENADANEFLIRYCAQEDWRTTRAVVFLDPFATQVQWTTIEAIARTRAIDLWILFPLMAVNRLLARDAEKACREPLDRIFGTEEWFTEFYHTHRLDTIFGKPVETVQKRCNTDSVGDFFIRRLKSVFSGVCPKGRVLMNSRDSPLFLLCFAAGNPKGSLIATTIASHVLERI